MKKYLVLGVLLLAAAGNAAAQTVTVYADKIYRAPLQEIAVLFQGATGLDVRLVCRDSEKLAHQILNDAEADLFFPAQESAMRRVLEKGLVDVALKRNILLAPPSEPASPESPAEPQYLSAAVLQQAPHRVAALAFLEFLTSEPARAVFARHGFSLP